VGLLQMLLPKQDIFIDIPVNLNNLLDSIIVHPNTDLETVQKLLDNNNIKIRAAKSRFDNI
jgi:hypothetical protein